MRPGSLGLVLYATATALVITACGGGGGGGGAAIVPTPRPTMGISLGTPQQLLTTGELGLSYVPDMHTVVRAGSGGAYQVYITGITGVSNGSTVLLSTSAFDTFIPIVGSPQEATPVLQPSCLNHTSSCLENYDADYAGANAVWTASNGQDLLMLYHGETRAFGGVHNPHVPFYAVEALARSKDGGKTWAREGAIVSGADPLPTTNPTSLANGVPEGSAIVATDGYIYSFFPYFPTAGEPDYGPPTIQEARALASGDGAPGTWTKFYKGSFGSQPGLGGLGSSVIPSSAACKSPRQPWVTYSTYLKKYVIVFLCSSGWFYSTSPDLVTWSTPIQFYVAPNPEFTAGDLVEENVVFVTPGNSSNQVIGRTGYVLYAQGIWNVSSHELWRRSFTFNGQ